MLFSDLISSPLSMEEKSEVRELLSRMEIESPDFFKELSSQTQEKVKERLGQGFRLAREIEKLDQRGICLMFANSIPERISQCFRTQPDVLYIVGDPSHLDSVQSPLSFSVDEFKAHKLEGVFFADRPLESLLCNPDVVDSLRRSRSLIISDRLKSRANLKSSMGSDDDGGISEQKRTVFISGSRSQIEIPKSVQAALDSIKQHGLGVLIGDSERGVDNEIIDFLRMPLYDDVTLFTIKQTPRVYPEQGWKVAHVRADNSLPAQKQQMAKDREMANCATFGLAVFKPIEMNRRGNLQVSSGTLRNTIQMLLHGKKVKFFYLYEGEIRMKNLSKLEDLEGILEQYSEECILPNEEKIILSAKGVQPDETANQAKSKRIMNKYHELLKNEKKIIESSKDPQTSMSSSDPAQMTLPLFF